MQSFSSFIQFLCSVKSVEVKQLNSKSRDIPGGPVVRSLLSNAGDVGLIPVGELRIPTCCRATKPTCLKKIFVPQLRPDAAKNNSQIYPKQQQQQQTPNLQSRNQDLREKERKQISPRKEKLQ